jgi:hypothetical protein
MQFLYPPLNVISRLFLSKSAGPKVIVISGFHCICKIYTHTLFCAILSRIYVTRCVCSEIVHCVVTASFIVQKSQ